MHRRDSIINGGEAQQQTSTTSVNNDMGMTDFRQSPAVEEFDATAAALSRLSVLAESNSTDGGASPQLDNSTYETSTLSACPSPSKRSSEFFESSANSSELKRMRRDSTGHVGSPFAQDFSLDSTRTAMPCHIDLVGLGLEVETPELSQSPGSPAMTEVDDFSNMDVQLPVASIKAEVDGKETSPVRECAHVPLRRRAGSLPSIPSARWLAPSSRRKHAHKSKTSLATDPLEARKKTLSQSRRPPITQQTLRELELSEIFKNAQLRHDIVHDPNLQFRPNTDGERGAKKRDEADKYWLGIALELESVQDMSKSQLANSRLSLMFQEMKNILLSLVPVTEKSQLCATFDHELFVQSLHHGLFSAARFATYMSSLMKRHCAPMRDDAIDSTVSMLESAQTSTDFVAALRSTFDVLEMMKLDVANHQLRSLRGFLLETSVEFEKSWYVRKYTNKVLSPESSKAWYISLLKAQTDAKPDHRAIFTQGLTSFFRSDSELHIPSTFTFDQARLTALKKDVRDLVCLNVILLLAKQTDKSATSADIAALKADLWVLIQSDRSRSAERWRNARQDIALHLVSRKLGRDANGLPILPPRDQRDFAESWLQKHLSNASPIYKMLEARILSLITTIAYNTLTCTSHNGHSTTVEPEFGILDSCREEIASITRRLNTVADFHWKVHGANYISWSSK